jgi:folylpolyglutamate synthase/dihydropteroate synthase
MMALSNNFGNPHKNNFKIIHIAGTNGKGSVSIKAARCLG